MDTRFGTFFDLFLKKQYLSQLILLIMSGLRPAYCFPGLVTEVETWLKALDQNGHREELSGCCETPRASGKILEGYMKARVRKDVAFFRSNP